MISGNFFMSVAETSFPCAMLSRCLPAGELSTFRGCLQPAHWGFHSCNGLSVGADLGKWGQPALWRDVMARHQEAHLHVIVGGGDQVYNDGFWKTKPLEAGLNIPGAAKGKARLFANPIAVDGQDTLACRACRACRSAFIIPSHWRWSRR